MHSMRIEVSSGIGFGPTELAAFDAALIAAGVANFNLLVLSSVIPNGSEVVVRTDPLLAPSGSWGDRLYVVLAQHRVSLRNAEAWAGLGWVQDERTGRGLFVEHHGNAHAEVQQDIADSLTALCESRGESFGAQQMTIAGATCHAEPACAVVVATYQSAKWQ